MNEQKLTAKKTKPRISTGIRKKKMIKALEENNGLVTYAAKKVGISRTTHMEWLKNDPEYKQAVEDIKEAELDFTESMLKKNIKNGDTACILFALKCLGKERGYVEKPKEQSQNSLEDFAKACETIANLMGKRHE